MRRLLPLLFVCLSAHAELQMSFTSHSVTVQGITPRGTAVVSMYARSATENRRPLFQHADHVLADTDGDGSVTVNLVKEMSQQSLWFAADLTSGDWRVGSPEAWTPPRMERPVGARRNPAGQLDRIAASFDVLYVLLIRPGAGAWTLLTSDGGPGDVSEEPDGETSIDLSALSPIDRFGPPPRQLTGRDVVLVVDPRQLMYTVIAKQE